MRLLLINANTSETMTQLVHREALKFVRPETTLVSVTGRFGARYVASRASHAIAGHAALDCYAEHGADADAVALVCFGDPGLFALKEIAHQPVVGMAEAACLAAAAMGGRFAVVTGGERWGPMLRELVALFGLSDRLAHVETVAPTGADIAREPERALGLLADACSRCVTEHRADSVILGGAGLAGLPARIADRVPAPLIDSLEACIRMTELLAAQRPGKARSGSFAPTPAVESIGLGAALAARLAGRTA